MEKPEHMSSAGEAPSALADQYSLADVVRGPAQDLKDLRAGRISQSEALARSALAKQYFNGLRPVLVGHRYLGQRRARSAGPNNGAQLRRQARSVERPRRFDGQDLGEPAKPVYICRGCELWNEARFDPIKKKDQPPAVCPQCGRMDFDHFHSKGEAGRYMALKRMQDAGGSASSKRNGRSL